MKKLLPLLLLIAGIYMSASAQETIVSHEDSLRAKEYWHKAVRQRLGSQQRQLYLDSALSIMPGYAYYWQQKSMPLTKMYKHELAAPYLDSAVKYDAKRYIDYRAYVKCIFARRYREALNDFYEAKRLNGNIPIMDHVYDFYIGVSHLQLNNYDSAEYYFTKCIDERREKLGEDWVHHLHLFYLGIVYYEQEQHKKAIVAFDQALKLYPNFPDAKMYKGYCLRSMGKDEEALKVLYETKELVKKGYTMNEDNTRHIMYPYQLRTYYLQGAIRNAEKAVGKTK